MNSITRGFSLLLVGCCIALVASGRTKPMTWHTANGGTVDGVLNGVYGSLIHLTSHNCGAFVSLDTLTDDETRRVADYLKQNPEVSTWKASHADVTHALLGSLQVLRDDKLEPYDPSAKPEPEIYLIYFSAGWCGPCHQFTPELVKSYTRFRAALPDQFELIFVSDDRSGPDQLSYAREFRMPWPILKYSEIGHTPEIERWAGNGIPCLVALTRDGDLIYHTYDGDEYLGPEGVVDAFEQLIPQLAGTDPVVRRARHRLAVMQQVDRIGAGASRVVPYLLGFDRKRYGEISIPEVIAHLKVDEHGQVKEVQFDREISPYLSDLMMQDMRQWLFLPAIKDGKPCGSSVSLPIRPSVAHATGPAPKDGG